MTTENKKETAETGVTEDMKSAAAEQLAQVNEERTSDLRTFKRGGVQSARYVSEVFPFPEFSLDNISPASYLAQPEGEITGNIDTQKFSIVETRLKGLTFDQPGRPLQRGRTLRTVKWLKPSGVLVQVPFEAQVNNTAAGSTEDAIGLRRYVRKGGVIFYNFETGQPVYCFARNCWAAAMAPELRSDFPEHAALVGTGYCSLAHFQHTEPSRASRWASGGGSHGAFDINPTTTASRRSG